VARATPVPPGSQLGAGETTSRRARTGAYVVRKRAMSSAEGLDPERRSMTSRALSSSPMIPRATERLAPVSASADRYAAALPPNRAPTIRPSTARASERGTCARSRSVARTTSAVRASSRSPVNFASAATLDAVSALEPYMHRVPAGRSSCPARRSASSSRPSVPGASQRLASRDHSQTQAAKVLSGSFDRASRCAQPHDQRWASRSSRATWRTASACHFATLNQRERGASPSRPPVPGPV
jgi:hypothetical protein